MMNSAIKKLVLCAAAAMTFGASNFVVAQSNSSTIRVYGSTDTSACVADLFPADPNAQECGYIPRKPASQIAQITSNEQCADLMRRIIPTNVHSQFNFGFARFVPGQTFADGTTTSTMCSLSSEDFPSHTQYPGESGQVNCTSGGLLCPPAESVAHGGLFREIMRNFKITPEYTKVPNLENRLGYGGDLIIGGWFSFSDCTGTFWDGPAQINGGRLHLFLRVNK